MAKPWIKPLSEAEAQLVAIMTAPKAHRGGKRARRARRNRVVDAERLHELAQQSEGTGTLGAVLAETLGAS